MPDRKPEPPARQRFKDALRGLGPDPTTGSKSPIPGGSVPARNLGGMSGVNKARAVLVQDDDTSSRLTFHFNPSEWNDAESSNWGSASVANRSRPKYTYKEGGERVLTFSMLLDEVGKGQPYNRVENAIKWLRERMSPSEVRTVRRKPPKKKKFKADVLLLVRGERDVFRCHIKDMKVREDMFASGSSVPVRAWVDLTLVQNLEDDDLESSVGV